GRWKAQVCDRLIGVPKSTGRSKAFIGVKIQIAGRNTIRVYAASCPVPEGRKRSVIDEGTVDVVCRVLPCSRHSPVCVNSRPPKQIVAVPKTRRAVKGDIDKRVISNCACGGRKKSHCEGRHS